MPISIKNLPKGRISVPLLVCLWAPFALTVIEYYFIPATSLWRATVPLLLLGRVVGDVAPYLWWVGGVWIFAVILPACLLWALTATPPRALGLRLRGTSGDAKYYLLLYVLFVPVIYLMSRQVEFRAIYPFYHPQPGKGPLPFIEFELLYCLQFFAVEFFFRGMLVLGLKPTLGKNSVLVALAPYCMIHYHKPFVEALGAIGAGWVLGTLAWRTETILYGWGLHYAVALTMDLLALR